MKIRQGFVSNSSSSDYYYSSIKKEYWPDQDTKRTCIRCNSKVYFSYRFSVFMCNCKPIAPLTEARSERELQQEFSFAKEPLSDFEDDIPF